MGRLVIGWIGIDGGVTHAVDVEDAETTLCGAATKYTADSAWSVAPAPRCKSCKKAATDLQRSPKR